MTKQETLSIIKLLCALESWAWSTGNALPEHTLLDIEAVMEVLEREVLRPLETENHAPLEGLTWLQALARCRPVVVMDEPQMGMDTEAALKAFDDMKPLAKLRYSATHHKDHARNCV